MSHCLWVKIYIYLLYEMVVSFGVVNIVIKFNVVNSFTIVRITIKDINKGGKKIKRERER